MNSALEQVGRVWDPFAHLTRLVAVGGDVEDWRLKVPAKGACYLLEDAEHRPILLATVGDLRQALVRRLSGADAEEGGKRIDYRAVVRYVRWREVHSRFEADWAYLCNARRLFASQWRGMTKNWRAWWIGVDFEAAHPRFVAKDQPVGKPETWFGPVGEGKLARRCVEGLEDVFDLCREHHLLMQTPNATACAYKQMGKCPAPCDGSVSMEAYREQLQAAAGFLAGQREQRTDQITRQIKAASAELNFELAGRLKAQLDQMKVFEQEGTERLAELRAFRYVVLQAGRRKGTVRAFVVTPGRIHFAGEMQKKQRSEQVDYLAALAERCFAEDAEAEVARPEVGLVGWHMLCSKREGTFVWCGEGVERGELERWVEEVGGNDQ